MNTAEGLLLSDQDIMPATAIYLLLKHAPGAL